MRGTYRLKEIASQAGVSTATVSRVLNDRSGVSSEVREKILRIAKDLGYTPNINARRLATSSTQTIAFAIHKDHATSGDPFFPIIMAGAEAYLASQDYNCLLTSLDEQIMAHPRKYSVIKKGLADGVILAGPDIHSSFVIHLHAAGIPLVLVDNCLARTATNCVLNDDEGGAYDATRHLIQHGHQQIAFLSGPAAWVSNRERMRGYQRAMGEAGLEPRVQSGSETTLASGEAMMRKALAENPGFTAVCAVNDSVAIGAIRAAQTLGRQTPGDLAVIGFDDISWAAMSQPALSTIHVFKQRMGQVAAQCLLESLKDPVAPPARIILSTKLVLRDSCGDHSNM